MERWQSLTRQPRKWRVSALHPPNRRQLVQFGLLILPLALLIGGIVFILSPIWQQGFPWGSDSWGHLQRAQYMGSLIRQYGLVDGFAKSAWMPDWYLGDPMRVYYPPLALWLLGPLTALTNNVFFAYRLFVTAIFLILGTSVYTIGVRWGRNLWLALAGGLLAVAAPYTLRTVFSEGNLSRGVAILFLPWIVWLTETLLIEKRSHLAFALLSGLWALALMAHVMEAAIFAVAMGVYVVIRLLGDVYIPLRRGLLALLTIPAGLLLSALYLIPAYGHLELAGVPSLPADKIDLFSISLDALLPYHLSIEAISIGVVSLALALLIAYRAKAAQHQALVLVTLLCLWLAFGPRGGLFEFIPLKDSLLPERFLNAAAIFVPLIVATTAQVRLKPILIAAALLLVGVVEFSPAWRVVMMRATPPDETAIASALAQGSLDGRIAPLTLSNPTSSQIFLESVIGKHENVSGWALENTPQQDAVRRLISATTQSPNYLERVLSLWNVDYLVTRQTTTSDESIFASDFPYTQTSASDSLQLWQRTEPSAFAQVLTDRRMLIIGDNTTSWLYAFPFASEGESANPSDYSSDYLAHFSVIGLNRLAQDSDVEAALGDWVRQGNTLIADLSGLGSIYEQGYTLFGVHAFPLTLDESPQLHFSPDLSALSGAVNLSLTEGAWVGATYYGLDQVVASITYHGEDCPLLGYQQVGTGRVWFVGFNLFYALDVAEQFTARTFLADYLLRDTTVNQSLELVPFPVASLERSSDRVQFEYHADEAETVVLSMTYFPRWQAQLDNTPVEIKSHEHLTLVNLPPGDHTFTLNYNLYSSVAILGLAISACSLVGLSGAAYFMNQRPVKARADREGNFKQKLELPAPTPQPDFRHEICPSCGYPHAIAGPPTAETYPFMSIECPNCGFKMSDLA